jgi:hypothetical protein
MLRRLPHRLPVVFQSSRHSPDRQGQDRHKSYPTYALHFNGHQDIILLGVNDPRRQLKPFVDFVLRTTSGGSFPVFEHIRNLALSTASVTSWGDRSWEGGIWVGVKESCRCELARCAMCGQEILPAFLKCFPALTTLHIAAETQFWDDPNFPWGSFTEIDPVPRCGCIITSEVDNGTMSNEQEHCAETQRHKWPLVKGMDQFWYVSYREWECEIPELPFLEWIRRMWHAAWPYYRSLEYLDVRVLRRLKEETT